MTAPTCDHCGTPLRLEYRVGTKSVCWTHDTGPIGRWTCPDQTLIVDGVRPMATHNGAQWFEAVS